MKSSSTPALLTQPSRRTVLLSGAAGLLLSACGGGGDPVGLSPDTPTNPTNPANPINPGITGPWATPLTLTTGASLTANLLNIACNDAGDAIAVWQEGSAGGTRRLLGRRYRVDLGWDPVHEIAVTNNSHALEADLAMDVSGQAWVVWTQQFTVSNQTWAVRHLPLGGWQPAVKVNTTDDAVLTSQARVSVNVQGNAIVGWLSNRGDPTTQVLVRPWLGDSGWGPETIVNTDVNSNPTSMVLALGPLGDGVVGWIESYGARPTVWAARWNLASGGQLNGQITTVGSATDLSIATDANGTTLMAWRHVFAAAERVSTVRFPATGSPAPVVSRDNPAPGAVSQPSIDAGSPGQFSVVWSELLGTRRDAWGTQIAASDDAPPSVLLENDSSEDAHSVQIALDPTNEARAAWLRGAASQGEIWSARKPFNGPWRTPERIGNSTNDASSLHLAGSSGGRALVAWLQPEAGAQRVWVQHRQPG